MTISTDKQRTRFVIAEGDLRDALQYLKKAKQLESGDSIVLEALQSMAIICYARPFSHNERSLTSDVAPKLLIDEIGILSADELKTHDKYINLRVFSDWGC